MAGSLQGKSADWAQLHPSAAAVLVALLMFVLALSLFDPASGAAIAPQWGTSPSANQVVAIDFTVLGMALLLNRLAVLYATSGPVPVFTTLAGEKATLLNRGVAQFATAISLVIGTAMGLGALAWLGFRAGSFAVAIPLSVGAAWLGSVVVPITLRRYTPGGVWLTPTGITDRHLGVEVTLAWDDVASAEFGRPDFPVAVGTQRNKAHRVRYLAGPWKGPIRPRINMVFLATRELGINPGTLANVVVHYARNRAERYELGTEKSLTTLATLLDDSGDMHNYLQVSSEPPKPRTYPSVPRYAHVNVTVGEGVEPIEILTRTDKALRRAGASKQERGDYWEDATCADLDHLMATTRSWVSLSVE